MIEEISVEGANGRPAAILIVMNERVGAYLDDLHRE
jgi:hypothetical protein